MTPETNPVRVLFLDDEVSVVNALRRSLRREGYAVFTATSPDDALRIIGAEKIDVVVSDHLMPEMTGIEFFALASRLHHQVVRIMLTGQADVEMAIRAINDGQVNRFLTKPWDDAELKRVLRHAAREIETKRRIETANTTPRTAAPVVVTSSIQRDRSGAIVLEDAEAAFPH